MTDSATSALRPAPASGASKSVFEVRALFLALSVFTLINTGPFQVAALQLTGVRLTLDILSILIAPTVVITVWRNVGKALDLANLSFVLFWAFLLISVQWSRSSVARDAYLFQALFIMPLSYALGLALGRARLRYLALMLSVPALFVYVFFSVDFSDYRAAEEQIVTYQLYAQCYMLAAFASLAMAYMSRIVAVKIVFVLLIFFFVFALLQTGGRGAMLGAALAIGGALYYRHPKLRLPLLAGGLATLAFVYLFFDSVLLILAELAGQYKLFSIERTVIKIMEPAADELGRSGMALAAFEIWREHFVFGTGLGGYSYAAGLGDEAGNYPHNLFLEVLAEQGLVGFGLLMLFLGMTFKRLLQMLKVVTVDYAAFLIGLLLAALQNVWISGHTESATFFWMMTGWIIGLSWEYQDRLDEAQKAAP